MATVEPLILPRPQNQEPDIFIHADNGQTYTMWSLDGLRTIHDIYFALGKLVHPANGFHLRREGRIVEPYSEQPQYPDHLPLVASPGHYWIEAFGTEFITASAPKSSLQPQPAHEERDIRTLKTRLIERDHGCVVCHAEGHASFYEYPEDDFLLEPARIISPEFLERWNLHQLGDAETLQDPYMEAIPHEEDRKRMNSASNGFLMCLSHRKLYDNWGFVILPETHKIFALSPRCASLHDLEVTRPWRPTFFPGYPAVPHPAERILDTHVKIALAKAMMARSPIPTPAPAYAPAEVWEFAPEWFQPGQPSHLHGWVVAVDIEERRRTGVEYTEEGQADHSVVEPQDRYGTYYDQLIRTGGQARKVRRERAPEAWRQTSLRRDSEGSHRDNGSELDLRPDDDEGDGIPDEMERAEEDDGDSGSRSSSPGKRSSLDMVATQNRSLCSDEDCEEQESDEEPRDEKDEDGADEVEDDDTDDGNEGMGDEIPRENRDFRDKQEDDEMVEDSGGPTDSDESIYPTQRLFLESSPEESVVGRRSTRGTSDSSKRLEQAMGRPEERRISSIKREASWTPSIKIEEVDINATKMERQVSEFSDAKREGSGSRSRSSTANRELSEALPWKFVEKISANKRKRESSMISESTAVSQPPRLLGRPRARARVDTTTTVDHGIASGSGGSLSRSRYQYATKLRFDDERLDQGW